MDGAESDFYEKIRTLPGAQGYEVPLLQGGVLHACDEAWVLSQLIQPLSTGAQPRIVITCVPATMAAIGENPSFGLASDDAAGRTAAVKLASLARDAASRANTAAGRSNFVAAVELHSGPSRPQGSSSIASFQKSLEEICSWDWWGAALVVEHCDAFNPNYPPIKGLLTLEEELAAVRGARSTMGERGSSSLGICINWGRSVLETRDPATALLHCKAAAVEGLLHGLMFSGCSGDSGDYGPWTDCHSPLDVDAPGSLLTEARVRETVELCKSFSSLKFLGCKIKVSGQPSVEQRVAANGRVLDAIAGILQ